MCQLRDARAAQDAAAEALAVACQSADPIGCALQASWESVLREGVPEAFQALLDKMKKARP